MIFTKRRADWVGSVPLTGPSFEWSDVDLFVIHYAGVANTPDGDPTDGTVESWLRNTHAYYVRERGYSLGYSVAVDWRGMSWEIRGETYECAANRYVNGRSFAAILVTDGQDAASHAAIAESNWLIAQARTAVAPRPLTVLGHWQTTVRPYTSSTWAGTDCPGRGIRAQLDAGLFGRTPDPTIHLITDEDAMFQGLFQLRGTPYVFAVYPGRKVWMPDPATLAAAQALARLAKQPDTIQVVEDPAMFAALGACDTIPPNCDAWGRPVRG